MKTDAEKKQAPSTEEELRTKYYTLFRKYEKEGRLFYYENRMFNMRSPVFIGDEDLFTKCADYLTNNPIGYVECASKKKYAACTTQLEINGEMQSYIFLNEKKIHDYRTLVPHECTHAAVRTFQLLGVDPGIEGNKSGEITARLIGDMSGFVINKVEEFIARNKDEKSPKKPSGKKSK